MPKSEALIQSVLNDPTASYWLKNAIQSLLNRDCVDASIDAEFLAKLFVQRTREILTGAAAVSTSGAY